MKEIQLERGQVPIKLGIMVREPHIVAESSKVKENVQNVAR